MNYQDFASKMKYYSILYVEDDKNIREYITSFLQRYCKAVYACDSAEEGLILYEAHKPEILLLDISLGGMSGIEFSTLIRKNDTHTRILISTAYTNKEFMLQAVELGLTRYLVKPMTNEDLVTALEKCWQELENVNQVALGEGYSYYKSMACVMHGEEKTILRHKEVLLLELFIEHEGEVMRYEWIEESIWKDEFMTRDAIRSQVRNIRKKLPRDILENVSGLGYRFKRKI